MSQIMYYAILIGMMSKYCCPPMFLTQTAGHTLTYKATKETKVAQRSVGMSSCCNLQNT